MKPNFVQTLKKSSMILPLALLMMGNQQCNTPVEKQRELRRRVQMGMIDAPPMPISAGGTFDFKFAANAQMYEVLRKTQSFTTATVQSGPFDIGKMTQADQDAFNRCDDAILNSSSLNVMSKTSNLSTVATCMIDMPQAIVKGSILNFELTNAGGLTLGIPQWANFGLSVDVRKTVLTMALQADDPLIPNYNLAATTAKANRQETNLSATINLGAFSVGPKAYFKSDLAGVVNKAMENGITDLKQQMDQNAPWYAMVLKNCDKAILINAGSMADAGLKKGDLLEIYNVRYKWSGNICDSTLEGSINASGDPIAVAEVDIVGDTLSQAKIIEQTETKIQPGSRVYVRKLIQPVAPKTAATVK
jgi:hypothetical protein